MDWSEAATTDSATGCMARTNSTDAQTNPDAAGRSSHDAPLLLPRSALSASLVPLLIVSLVVALCVQCPIVERLITAMMFHGRNNGKKQMAQKIVKHTCEIMHLVTGNNPLQIIADAVAKSGPREDSTRIGSSGVVRRQAVDVSPLRRVNQAIYLLTTGARNTAFRNIKSVAECLADELINAANDNQNSYAIKKKDEIERVAKANR